jgi:catechol 2,3-dioxygenase-like lactoylglutathione lyase family enzyme
MFDYQGIYHVGVLVTDLEAAMADLGASLGVTWTNVEDRQMPVHYQGEDLTVGLRFCYSKEGPQHIELLQGEAGSYWDGTGRDGLHHTGIWTDNVTADTEALIAAGGTLEISRGRPDGAKGFGTFTYVRTVTGLLVELVDSAAKPRFESWWSGTHDLTGQPL